MAFTPQRVFGTRAASLDFLSHAPFLDRARAEREQGREEASRVALGAYLVARLVGRLPLLEESEEERESFEWQLGSTRRFVSELPQDHAETAHLLGIVDAASSPPQKLIPVLRMSLMAYAYYLEHEGRFEEALQVLSDSAQTYRDNIPPAEASSLALFAGRLNRVLARWDAANGAYRAAEEAGQELRDERSVLLSRLGRANVRRCQGNLPQAKAEIEAILSEASRPTLADVRARAYADLGVVFDLQGLTLNSLQAHYHALTCCDDEVVRCRILGDIGVTMRDLGAWDAARQAFEIVAASQASFVVKANAYLELMDIESAVGNRVAFERRRQDAQDYADRMPPSMQVDLRFKLGVGMARFGQVSRARKALVEGQNLAEEFKLNEWYFRIERVLKHIDVCPDSVVPAETEKMAEVWETPAIAEVAAGLERYASPFAE